jgi:uncharacterized membrane protein YkoI
MIVVARGTQRAVGFFLPVMNSKFVGLLSAVLAATINVVQAQEQRVRAAELPAAVRSALEQTSKGEPIKTINRRVIDGHVVYDIELERDNAINPRFRITEDGIVVAGMPRPTSDPATEPVPTYDGIVVPQALDPMIPVEELPAAVRETIKKQATGRPIADIDRETWRGRIVYEVEFKASGRNPQVHIAEDGTVVRAEERREGKIDAAIRSLFLGTQLEDTPPAVQTTIRREARDRAIEDIDIERRNGERIYEVKIADVRSPFEIQVAEDGRILHDIRPEASTTRKK